MEGVEKDISVVDDATLVDMLEAAVEATMLGSVKLSTKLLKYRMSRVRTLKNEILRRLQEVREYVRNRWGFDLRNTAR